MFLCHPNNPTGKVYRADELALLAELCARWDAVLVVDSIYEHIHQLGPGGYLPPALVPGLEDRTVTVNALSKTYAVTGWRVGWTLAPAEITAAIRKVHDFLTIAAPAPLQAAGVAALGLPAELLRRAGRACTASAATCCAARWRSSGSTSAARTARTTCCATSAASPPTATASRSPVG